MDRIRPEKKVEVNEGPGTEDAKTRCIRCLDECCISLSNSKHI